MKTLLTLRRILLFCCFCCTLSVARAQYMPIPDANFGTYLYNNGYASCMTGSSGSGWQIDPTCAGQQYVPDLNMDNLGITDLTGIEYLTNTAHISCRYNNIPYINDLPMYLLTLDCSNSHVQSLPFSLPNNLMYLYVNDNDLYDNIINLPTSLVDYTCSNNHTTYLPGLPSTLQILTCSGNQISQLTTLPASLRRLYCDYNPITTLPVLPAGLTDFWMQACGLTSLPALPSSITNMEVNLNLLTVLPTLPPNLSTLGCNQNQLTSLPALPATLQDLDCNQNSITVMPALPRTMYRLDCHSNLLSTLPALPDTISSINCSYNQLTSLPAMPRAMGSLICSGNLITSMPLLPNTMYLLKCDDNDIRSFVNIPSYLTTFTLYLNRHLSCLPRITQTQFTEFKFGSTALTCLPSRFSATTFDLNPGTMPLCTPASGCDFYYNIAGGIHNDVSANCTSDSINPGAPITNVKVQLKQGGSVIQQFYTFSSGGYSFKTPAYGTYTVNIDTTSLPITVACPQSDLRTVTISAIDSIKRNESFGMQCSVTDFAVAHIEAPTFRASLQQLTAHIEAGNVALLNYHATCGSGSSGTVTTTYTNSGVHYTGPAPGSLTPTSVSGNTLTYNIADLNTLGSHSLDILFSVDASAVLGSTTCITTTVTSSGSDPVPGNNTLTQCFTITNSLDPNYKEAYPERIQPGAADWLTYTIHFQNTGNDTAYLVILRDTLSSNLDASSFQYLASSHHAVIQLDHNAMTFTFPHINLVDSATNPPLSEGWIQYRVKANGNLTDGTAINNTAYIYFDNNPAVVTNTATTNVTLLTCSDTTSTLSQSICSGDTFMFYGQALTAQGTYNDTFPRAGGCDSIISLTLVVHPKYIAPATYDTICDGGTLSYHGQSLTSAGTYNATLQTIHGCDSMVSIVLAVRPSDMTMIEDTICSGSSYAFYGQSLTATGMYLDTLSNVHGCDSVIMLMLEVRASDTTRMADTICSGASYTFYGRSLTAAGTYVDTMHNVHGCDSLIVLDLQVRSLPVVNFSWDSLVATHYLDYRSFVDSNAIWCELAFPRYMIPLTGGSPSGGTFSGLGVQNDTLNGHFAMQHLSGFPALDTIYYTYTDVHGCSNVTSAILVVTVCEGINDVANLNDIHLYPNPNTGTFALQISNSHNSSYIITDMLGNMIEEKAITSDTQAIDMHEAAAGVYTLTVKGTQSSRQVKFVVVR
ncbi:MAG: hypothetical protein JWO03_2925 [Bacteroidetes bacterium]|nr:hypothetical protein [Bacteroidota bacterium]